MKHKETIFIAAGSSDIGYDIIKQNYDKYNIYTTYYSNTEFYNEIKHTYPNVVIEKRDLRNPKDIQKAISSAIKYFNSIDILINLPAISQFSLFIDISDEEIQNILNINLFSYIYTCKYILPHMLKNNVGKIINISSFLADQGAVCESIYALSKAGINSLTKSLAKEYASSNILINAIAPGYINTKMNQHYSIEDRAECLKNIPLNRFGEVEDITLCINFLIDSKYITGEIININGGWF